MKASFRKEAKEVLESGEIISIIFIYLQVNIKSFTPYVSFGQNHLTCSDISQTFTTNLLLKLTYQHIFTRDIIVLFCKNPRHSFVSQVNTLSPNLLQGYKTL